MPGHHITSRMVSDIFNLTRHRISVAVYIKRRHEDRNLQPCIFKILILFSLFNNNHFPVCRGINQSLGRIESSFRPSEEKQKENIQHEGKYKKTPFKELQISPQNVNNDIQDKECNKSE